MTSAAGADLIDAARYGEVDEVQAALAAGADANAADERGRTGANGEATAPWPATQAVCFFDRQAQN